MADPTLCPFNCGTDDGVDVFDGCDSDGVTYWFARCLTCGASGPEADSRDEALDLWGRRLGEECDPTDEEDEIAALRAVVEEAVRLRKRAERETFALGQLDWWPSDEWCQRARAALNLGTHTENPES